LGESRGGNRKVTTVLVVVFVVVGVGIVLPPLAILACCLWWFSPFCPFPFCWGCQSLGPFKNKFTTNRGILLPPFGEFRILEEEKVLLFGMNLLGMNGWMLCELTPPLDANGNGVTFPRKKWMKGKDERDMQKRGVELIASAPKWVIKVRGSASAPLVPIPFA
jgi:hypothetical protein